MKHAFISLRHFSYSCIKGKRGLRMIKKAAEIIKNAKHVCAFTGAGISVESGIPPFRGENGLWNIYDPSFIEIENFYREYAACWVLIKKIFYDYFGKAKPNEAHIGLAKMESVGYVKSIITQNIDNLHTCAGNKMVFEFHGTSERIICLSCNKKFDARKISFNIMPPRCPNCGAKSLKPDFVFFGEGIPEPAQSLSYKEAEIADVFLVIGTTGEVMPACLIPQIAKHNGAKIIEINPEPSAFTRQITNLYIKSPATEAVSELCKELQL